MCRGSDLFLVLDLGHHPPSDAFLRPDQLLDQEASYPLRLISCKNCGLLQIDYAVHPEILYQRDYPYESSTTKTGRDHYYSMAKDMHDNFPGPKGLLAIDVGSNVGVLLQGFKNLGYKVLGVDPAEAAGQKAIDNGIDTVGDFFNEDSAGKIKEKYGLARFITATNCFGHILELDSTVRGMVNLLAKKGVIAVESPYALELIENLEYDTIYHEHICYLSVKPMKLYLKRFGLELFDVKRSSIHGGSMRYYIGHIGEHPVRRSVNACLVGEEAGLYSEKKLKLFASKVKKQRMALVSLIMDLKKQGKAVVGVAAPAKGNTLLNYCKLDINFLDFLTEKTQIKIGRYSPGMHIPVYSDDHLFKKKPDYALILAWNFADEIMANLAQFKKRGGKFIIPIPTPKII
ncbi:MAG: methyltransferase [Candidatus Yanofskybacteria bacterium CG10_big_fil_rev_8_21_14_0_10_46_23]|uniref:Methyltransferase n=1 Tax=Candidatus Yanofskybacteria bacterium CG10_big_fil_rev_8_21_14_0_10_46_23 TaxID=1975098 RepID=A0A2H0R572_9BACT|nr:MAG: methyltransferase [Candidatus Yanofskybacteria bacterium CG10_big_fil_rev_8_21_14_0_10_46_23]